MAFFRITLIRSAIGLPQKTRGQIMKVKELVAVSEVEKALSKAEVKAQRTPDPGYYIESPGLGAG
ncbi:uncharacterized protein KY384_004335 [Bacidia gigantensis]|uniref:uncharacterized protein n=1 Tax=Bacidia gigantensis TaxID=2732470 RepID=UPI001D03C281|nr:uncharacterized protein KY384_004335 [Bacidia gigantensis]KAG8530978.1 hypothetical protein KY384_004335 [Bacidia gigantensis]